MGGGRRTSLVAAASASLFIVALPATVAVAASIVGTDGAETIRGTRGADRISTAYSAIVWPSSRVIRLSWCEASMNEIDRCPAT
jgi:hypothetical protein